MECYLTGVTLPISPGVLDDRFNGNTWKYSMEKNCRNTYCVAVDRRKSCSPSILRFSSSSNSSSSRGNGGSGGGGSRGNSSSNSSTVYDFRARSIKGQQRIFWRVLSSSHRVGLWQVQGATRPLQRLISPCRCTQPGDAMAPLSYSCNYAIEGLNPLLSQASSANGTIFDTQTLGSHACLSIPNSQDSLSFRLLTWVAAW